MDTFWSFFGWWCVLPMLVFGAFVLACLLGFGRRGACGCMGGRAHEGGQPPRGPAA